MSNRIANLSLRTRLWLLAALTAGALVVVLFVAWQLARATELFEVRRSEWTLHAAGAALANDLKLHPQGRTEAFETINDEPPAPPRPVERPRARAPKPVPPHERKIMRLYSDPLERLAAIVLHRFPRVSGGFIRTDGELTGGVPPFEKRRNDQTLTPEEVAEVRRLAQRAAATNEPANGRLQTTGSVALFEV
ncbi:MAG: hypothetical protein LC742_03220, partial [Acidobacteria bacterium]|nr:hypothetical protein [Acidobacteriota bacterium]